MSGKLKSSSVLLEMRKKEQALARLKKYEEAELIKAKADELELRERQKLELYNLEQLEKKETKIRNFHQLTTAALLKRIQRDRNEQVKQRQQDSMRLIQRNKNLLNTVLNKHGLEVKKALEALKRAFGLGNTNEGPNSPKFA